MDTQFLDELASKAPTPGGGGAAAYAGALAAALTSMVGNLTVGKKKYAAVEGHVQMALDDLEAIRGELVELIDADARAFAPLAACYGMPRDTPEQVKAREEAMQKALVDAIEVPLEIMGTCVEVLEECDYMAQNGSRLALSDAGCAAAIGRAAVQAASLNVVINIKSLTDRDLAASYRDKMNTLLKRSDELYNKVFPYVVERLS